MAWSPMCPLTGPNALPKKGSRSAANAEQHYLRTTRKLAARLRDGLTACYPPTVIAYDVQQTRHPHTIRGHRPNNLAKHCSKPANRKD
eukprot:1307789-Amphidinium_carterae.1